MVIPRLKLFIYAFDGCVDSNDIPHSANPAGTLCDDWAFGTEQSAFESALAVCSAEITDVQKLDVWVFSQVLLNVGGFATAGQTCDLYLLHK